MRSAEPAAQVLNNVAITVQEAPDEEHLKREVWNTLIREIGAYLGMTEAQLHELYETCKR